MTNEELVITYKEWKKRSEELLNQGLADTLENIEIYDSTIKALEQQPCEDWYDVPSDEMTLEQARQAVKDLREKLAEYLEQQPCDDNWRFYYNHGYAQAKRDLSCEDCISRQAVDELSKELVRTTRDKADFLCNFWEGLQKLPPVTPKEKTAAWVPTDEEPHEVYECNACGWLLYDEDRTDFKYCPNCGARMVSE